MEFLSEQNTILFLLLFSHGIWDMKIMEEQTENGLHHS